ncbi:hypothetical protein F5X98DRAFT_327585 [Xylaria grammica]|nr:hypothetical protein F5X98DRAFT_327585 [Xylaria grammica]
MMCCLLPGIMTPFFFLRGVNQAISNINALPNSWNSIALQCETSSARVFQRDKKDEGRLRSLPWVDGTRYSYLLSISRCDQEW